MSGPELQTQRLLLRSWRDSDIGPFAEMSADPAVMEFFPSTLTSGESAAFVARTSASFEDRGFGMWAVQVTDGPAFIGFVGLGFVDAAYPFGPAVEVGWRLARRFWGNGYATEAARASLGFGFTALALEQIVSFTVPTNRRSRAVMERLGMRRDAGADFEHPRVDEGHPLRPHVLYRMDAATWRGIGA